jgi:hypothetical protein
MHPDNKITVWITKYAMTKGIEKKEAILSLELWPSGSTVEVKYTYNTAYFHSEGKDWHRTEASALSRAEEMRLAKIASLKKQIAKLEKMKFGE